MTFSAHMRTILTLGLPIIGSHLGQMAIGVTDTMMLGWYGAHELAAVTLGATLLHLLFLVGSGFAWAVMPLVATFNAEGDETSLRRATRMGLWLSLAFAAIVLPVLMLSEPILRLLGQGEALAASGALYLRIAGWGIIPMLSVMVIKSYLSALEHTRPVLWIILISALLNGLINWAFIFGNWGAPELGIAGAAWASNVTQLFTLICVVAYARLRLPEHDIFRRLWKVDIEMMARVFRLGWPIGLTTLSEAGLFSASVVMMGWLGTIPLAAHGIVVQLASVTFMVHMGLSNVATVRAGNALGWRDADYMARGAWVVTALSLGFAAMTIAAFLLIPHALMRLFLDPGEPAIGQILELGTYLLIAAALFQLVDGAQVIALGLLRGVQDTTVPMIMAAFSYWGVGLPLSYVLGFMLEMGGFGVWLGLAGGLGCACVALMGRFWFAVLPRLSRALV